MKAHSLIELLITLVIISILTMAIFPVLRQKITHARVERILEDLEAIAEAGADYYKSTETVPDSISNLVNDGYMENITSNPYGNSYSLEIATADKITVRTVIPKGLIFSIMDSRITVTSGGVSDTVDFSQPVEYNLPEEQFEKRHLYEPEE